MQGLVKGSLDVAALHLYSLIPEETPAVESLAQALLRQVVQEKDEGKGKRVRAYPEMHQQWSQSLCHPAKALDGKESSVSSLHLG